MFSNTNRRDLAVWSGLAGWSILITIVTYGSAIQLPFFFDDFVHLPFVDSHSPLEIWQTAAGLGYYRPLAFAIWKSMYLVLGYHSAVGQHLLNLLLHVLNGLLVALFVHHLWSATDSRFDSWLRRFLSATLFLLYPFSYQAIPWVGSISHPLVTAIILLSLISYMQMRKSGRRTWGAMSLALAFLAPFAHESGVLVGPLIGLIELTPTVRSESVRRGLMRAAAWSLPALIWLPIWWLAPKGINSSGLILNNGEALLQNSTYFVQGIAYPFSWLGGWLHDTLGVNDISAAIGLSLVTLISAALIQWHSAAGRRTWLPWGWCALTSGLAIFFLPFDYVINGPRLLLLASVGIALLWSDVILRIIKRGQSMLQRRVNVALAVSLCLMLLLQNYSFIRDRMILYEIGGSVIRQVSAATTAANESEQVAIFVNLPAWLAPPQATYAIGHEGIEFLPGYVPHHAIVSVNTGKVATLDAIRYEPIRPEMPYFYGLRGAPPDWPRLLEAGGQVFVASYYPEQVLIQPAGILRPPLRADAPSTLFDETIELLDADATINEEGLQVNLTWQVQTPPESHVTVFVHVLDGSGQLIAQADGDPLAGAYPFFQWTPGSITEDIRLLELSASNLSLRVGLYDRLTGERLTATASDGTSWPDNAVYIGIGSE